MKVYVILHLAVWMWMDLEKRQKSTRLKMCGRLLARIFVSKQNDEREVVFQNGAYITRSSEGEII